MPEVTDHTADNVASGRAIFEVYRATFTNIELERCGHSMALDRPAELARVMGDFFAGHAADAAA